MKPNRAKPNKPRPLFLYGQTVAHVQDNIIGYEVVIVKAQIIKRSIPTLIRWLERANNFLKSLEEGK